ncbi:unnamed protein product, partial [Sphacelaria rigidula]
MVAVLKVWEPDEMLAAMLAEGSELRLHRVAASICRQHVPGCSLDLSAGRQTKIEVMRSNQLGPRSVPSPGCASQPPDPRYSTRHCTPLAELTAAEEGVGATSNSHRRRPKLARSSIVGEGVDFVGCIYAVTREEHSTAAAAAGGGQEVMIVPSSPETAPNVWRGGGKDDRNTAQSSTVRGSHSAKDGDRDNNGAEACGDGGGDGGDESSTCGKAGELVTFRVYMTDQSGACVRLETQIRRELVQHHRILRSSPGSCWAVLNASGSSSTLRMPGGGSCGGGSSYSVDAEIGNSRHSSSSSSPAAATTATSRADHAPSAAPPITAAALAPACRGDTGAACNTPLETLRWSSMTAIVGGSGATPPATIAGTPAGHIAQPLLGLRRWAEGEEGRRAVRREGQRLGLQVAAATSRNRAAETAIRLGVINCPNANVSNAGCSPHTEQLKMERPDARGHPSPNPVVGFVESFVIVGAGEGEAPEAPLGAAAAAPEVDPPLEHIAEAHASASAPSLCGGGTALHGENTCGPVEYSRNKTQRRDGAGMSNSSDLGALWVRIDTGEELVPLQIPTEGVLEQLLRKTLRGGRGGSSCTWSCSLLQSEAGRDAKKVSVQLPTMATA